MEASLSINLVGLPLPVVLRTETTLTDEQLMQFSEANKPCKIERNQQGEITVMTPVGGSGSTHEALVASALYQWDEAALTGEVFISNAGFNLPDGSCLSPDVAWVSLARWTALTPGQQAGYPPLCPEFLIEVRFSKRLSSPSRNQDASLARKWCTARLASRPDRRQRGDL